MKLKFSLSVALVLLLCLSISACGNHHTECKDENGDGFCDGCKQSLSNEQKGELVLIEDGEALFQVVVAKDAFESLSTANSAIRAFLRNKHEISVNMIKEGDNNDEIMPTEILIGKVSSRGDEYINNGYALGPDDYVIKTIGSKIIINAGSVEKLNFAIREFSDRILKTGTPISIRIARTSGILSLAVTAIR